MWNSLTKEWQYTFKLAWEAFRNGSIPIGAIIVDAYGNIISTGRNETTEKIKPNKRIAHAEMNCISNLNIEKYPDLGEYHLYTTMEPCPMCMGTIVMSGLRKIHVAAEDKYCGALHYITYDPFMKSKNMQIFLEKGEMEAVQLVQQGYHEIRRYNGAESNVLKQFRKTVPKSIEIAFQLYQGKYLDKCVEDNISYQVVYDYICNLFKSE